MEEKYLKLNEVCDMLSVTAQTPRRWDHTGKLKAIRTVGNQRRWRLSDIKKLSGDIIKSERDNSQLSVVTYARCSSTEQKQRGDIDRQSARILEYAVKRGYRVVDIIKDCGSGLNDKRKGFMKLLELVTSGKVDKVIIENKDRLTRFGFDMLTYMFRSYDVEIEIVQNRSDDEYQDLAQDIMMLIASFSGKLYRKRALERRKTQTEAK